MDTEVFKPRGRYQRKISKTIVGKIQDVDWVNKRQNRSGIVPYIIFNGEILFCLGKDSQFKTYTDFAGGVKHRETVWSAANREFMEETMGVFGNPVDKYSDKAIIAYNDNSMTIFYFFDIINNQDDMEKLHNNFLSLQGVETEVSDFRWLTSKELSHAIKLSEPPTYIRVRELLIENIDDIISRIEKMNQ